MSSRKSSTNRKGGDTARTPKESQPKLDELLVQTKDVPVGDVLTTEQVDEERQRDTAQALKERETERLGRQKYYELRDKWSDYIHDYVWFMLGFQVLLTVLIGTNLLDFSEYTFFLNLVIGQNFAQIIGMGVIVAKFLFPNKQD